MISYNSVIGGLFIFFKKILKGSGKRFLKEAQICEKQLTVL